MKRAQLFPFYLVFLFLSAFEHDYTSAIHLGHEGRHQKTTKLLSQFRESSKNQCSWICDSKSTLDHTTSLGLNLMINAEDNIIALANDTANVAIVFDITANLALLLNGNTGDASLLNLDDSAGVVIAANTTSKTWIQKYSSINSWLRGTRTLKSFLNISGQNFAFGQASTGLRKHDAVIITQLDQELGDAIKQDLKQITRIVDISNIIISAFCNNLAILIKGAGFQVIRLSQGLTRFLGMVNGLSYLDQKMNGGLKNMLNKTDVKLKLNTIFGSVTGMELFVNILGQAADKIDFSIVFGDLLENPELFFEIIMELSAGSYKGANGEFILIHYLKSYSEKSITLEQLLDVVIEISSSAGTATHAKTAIDLQNLVDFIQNQTTNFNSKAKWSLILNILVSFQNGNYSIGGINSNAVADLIENSKIGRGLDLSVSIVFLFQTVAPLELTIPTIFSRILLQINEPGGVYIISRLIPDVSITIDPLSPKSAVEQILAKVDVAVLTKYIVTLDVTGLIKHLPTIGDIFLALEATVKTQSNGSIELTSLFKASAAATVTNSIQKLLWDLLHVTSSLPIATPPSLVIDSFTVDEGETKQQ